MNKIFLGIGANVGNKEKNIEKALKLLGEKIINIKKSNIYKTKPFGVTKQENFLNLVISGETRLTQEELLKFVKDIEKKIGRIFRFRWGPREIDIDILFYNSQIFENENLKIPHIGIPERDFVLKPFLDLQKDFIHPKFNKTIEELYEELDEKDYTIIS